ncbi:hypothetical protein SLE2022_014700 [Rubroshorea leprosula]
MCGNIISASMRGNDIVSCLYSTADLAVEYTGSYHPRLSFLPHFCFSLCGGRSGFFSNEACCRCSSPLRPLFSGSTPMPVSSTLSRSMD